MPIKSFLKLVEIQTKVASVIPFTLGSVFVYYRYGVFNLKNFIFMFISLLTFDMTATAINNYLDYKKAIKKKGYNYETHNVIVRDNLAQSTVVVTIILLLSTAITFGLLLYLNTDNIVLILGIISFMIGILYSFGPIPISRMPLGEIFSGLFMGFIIVFLAVYIHISELINFDLALQGGLLEMTVNIKELLSLFLISVPTVNGIANIMLANNICDIEDDIENKRYTLPIYIGRNSSLKLFRAIYYSTYIAIVVGIGLGILPLSSLLVLGTLLFVNKNINRFSEKQTKKDTFALSVKNFVIINLVYIGTIAIGIIL